MIEKFLKYLSAVRRYSPKTIENYRRVLAEFCAFVNSDVVRMSPPGACRPRHGSGGTMQRSGMVGSEEIEGICDSANSRESSDSPEVTANHSEIDYQTVRDYEVYLIDTRKEKAATVNQHLSVLSSYCRFLMKEGVLQNNPVHLVMRPKQEKRLPQFYRDEAMQNYFETHKGTLEYGDYDAQLRYMIISMLANTGIRRAELIDLNVASVDLARKVLRVHGKGDKMRDVPLVPSLCEELELYLNAVVSLPDAAIGPDAPLLQTKKGGRLYPVLVDRAVKQELGSMPDFTARKSPHVLRHTLATDLLDSGSDINSIKELLGHSSLAATQIYTHNSIERLQSVYQKAHPRAKMDQDCNSDKNSTEQ